MSKADQLVDRGADRLRELADQAAAKGGLGAKLAQPLAEDAAFLRKLKPSLMAARAKGHAPTDQKPETETVGPTTPQLGPRPKKKRTHGGGPNPLLVMGAALVVGVLLAKVVDWRGHAHPRD